MGVFNSKVNMKKFYRILLFSLFCLFYNSVNAQIYLGYSDNEIANGIALGQNITSSAAIYIPESLAKLYEGKEATAVRLGLSNNVSNMKVFITKDLNGEPLSEAEFGSQKPGLLSFNLNEPVVLDGDAFYVGYTCTGTNVIGCSNVYDENGCWLKSNENGGEWSNYAMDESYQYNALNLSVRIEGSTLPFDARLIVNKEYFVSPGEEQEIDVKLENLSKTAIRKFQVKYSIDGGEESVIEESVYLKSGATTKFAITLPAFSGIGEHKVNLSLLKVNDMEDDNQANNEVETTVKVTGVSFEKRMVVEEGTGTWCGYCPEGIVAFRAMEEKYPDKFIGIAVHHNDAMAIDSYNKVKEYFTGYPKCIINRNESMIVSPTASVLEGFYGKVISERAIAAVSVEASLDDNSNKINAKTSVQFASGDPDAEFRIAFVVVEDSVTGYSQHNYYAGGVKGEMGGFENMGEWVSMPMNHVARGIYDYDGLDGSLPSVIEADVPYDYEMQIDLPKVQKTDYLHIIALLINGKSGMIENAAKSKIQVGTGLSCEKDSNVQIWIDENGNVICSENDGVIEVYDMNGVCVSGSGLERGLYIVKYTDSTEKTVVRKVVY